MNKPTYPELNAVQGSRSISSTCPRKGSLASLLRFQYESTVTSDGIAQKIGNNILHDFELTSIKICSQTGSK